MCYGAPAKGNTLLNYCGLSKTQIDYTVDKNPSKQNLFLPGTHIPIFSPEKMNDIIIMKRGDKFNRLVVILFPIKAI